MSGKTELAKAVSRCLGWDLIRLQCYEGLDEAKALYEWEYAKQLLYTQMMKEKINQVIDGAVSLTEAADRIAAQEDAFFSERFIQPRPLLKAISSEKPVVLLVDEVDKSDPEFEAFLLEILSDFQISIPEIGTRKAAHIPFVILTSNNYRDMSDALKRRCLAPVHRLSGQGSRIQDRASENPRLCSRNCATRLSNRSRPSGR